MSDISNISSSSSKRRLNLLDNKIEYLTQEINTLNDFVYKTELECSLMTLKMRREKVKALSAVAKSEFILANMNILIAESELVTDVERLRNSKRRKLNRYGGESRVNTPSPRQVTPPLTTTTVSVQTTESMTEIKKKAKRSSSRRKSPVDITSEDTVIIPSIHEISTMLEEPSQMSQTSFSHGLFTKFPAEKSDSEVSLTSSIKAEFNEPYINTFTQEPVDKSPAKKHKSEKKVESKSKSKHVSMSPRRSHTRSPTETPTTVTDNKKSGNMGSNHMELSSRAVSTPKNSRNGDKKSTASATYVPVRHNMGVLQTQPCTSTMGPFGYINHAKQGKTQQNAQKPSPAYNFYGPTQ